MRGLTNVLAGPWRAVLVLGITQIMAWGVLFYPTVMTVPLIAAEQDWSTAFAMSGFSVAMLSAGLASPTVGRLIDRHGGHVVMPAAAGIGALGLAGLALADDLVIYLLAWGLIGLAIAGSLYDPAFATLGRIFGRSARGPITALTLAGGFASTVSWPVTYLLIGNVDWRGTYMVYAALLVLFVAPILAFGLPRDRADRAVVSDRDHDRPVTVFLPASGRTFTLVMIAFTAFAFVPSGASAHMLAIFGRYGIDAGAVVVIGMLFGPSQVLARIGEMVFARQVHPLLIARGACLLLGAGFVLFVAFGVVTVAAAIFMVLFGMANGLMTIARGTVPLALFGPSGYGHMMGRIGGPYLVMQAVAPLALAIMIDRTSDGWALGTLAAFALAACVSFVAIRNPAPMR